MHIIPFKCYFYLIIFKIFMLNVFITLKEIEQIEIDLNEYESEKVVLNKAEK